MQPLISQLDMIGGRIEREQCLWVAEIPSMPVDSHPGKRRDQQTLKSSHTIPPQPKPQCCVGKPILVFSWLSAIVGFPGDSSRSLPQILMVPTTHQRHLDHRAILRRLNGPWNGTITGEGPARPYFLVIFEIGLERLVELGLIDDDNLVQTFSSDRADESLDVRLLPRRSRSDQFLFDNHLIPPDAQRLVRKWNHGPATGTWVECLTTCCAVHAAVGASVMLK
jgi:hypothetical protein